MTNIDRYRVAVVFLTMTIFLAPLRAFAGTGGMGGLGAALAMLGGMILFVFLITTAIAIALLKLRRTNQGWRRTVVSIILLVYTVLYIPLILKLFLKDSFSYQYYHLDQAGLGNYIIAFSSLPVIGLFLLKEYLAKRFTTVIWLSAGFVLVPVALLYTIVAVASVSFIGNLSPSGIESFATIPLILAAVLVTGAIINTRISTNTVKVHVLFIALFVLAAVIMRRDHYGYALWAIIGIASAWIFQIKSTKNRQRNENHNRNAVQSAKSSQPGHTEAAGSRIIVADLPVNHTMNKRKVLKIILAVILAPYILTGFAFNPWCFTRGMGNFGIKTLSPYDAKDVTLTDSKTLLIESDSLIRNGNDRFSRQSDRRLTMRCDLTASLDTRKDVTEAIRNRQFYEIPWDIKYGLISDSSGTSRVYSAQWVQCVLESNSGHMSGIKVPLITDETLENAARQRQTFFYTAGNFKYHPMKKYLAIRDNQDETVIPISFVYEGYESKLTEKSAYWMLRYLLYPLAVVADVATYPLQWFSLLDRRNCPEWTCGP